MSQLGRLTDLRLHATLGGDAPALRSLTEHLVVPLVLLTVGHGKLGDRVIVKSLHVLVARLSAPRLRMPTTFNWVCQRSRSRIAANSRMAWRCDATAATTAMRRSLGPIPRSRPQISKVEASRLTSHYLTSAPPGRPTAGAATRTGRVGRRQTRRRPTSCQPATGRAILC